VDPKTDMPLHRAASLAGLVQRPQAARTEIHPTLTPFIFNMHALDVGFELAVGCPFRMANIVPKLRALATDFAFCHHNHLAVVRSETYLTTRCSFTQLANIRGGNMPEVLKKGPIEVSAKAIASIASNAVLTSYGVVGTATRDVATGIAEILNRDSTPGVIVSIKNGKIAIDVYVVVEYGTRIAVVARSVMSVVKYSVEQALGMSVKAVNVHVEGLRISNVD